MIRRARVLLALDTSMGEVDPEEVIAARVGVSGETLRLVAKRFAETGGDVRATIGRKQRAHPPVPSPVTGEVEARLIALACSTPPAGHARWTTVGSSSWCRAGGRNPRRTQTRYRCQS
jgi:hypothetical protein